MATVSQEFLRDMLELADALAAGADHMTSPQDLPGRYGRVIRALDHVLEAVRCEAVVAGGWAVWHHGYVGRVTADVDIALPADRIDEFLRVASVSGFELLPAKPGRWPKVVHKDTHVRVDILPEGARPGMASKPAPTTIPHPGAMGAQEGSLRYISLASLVELKLAAGRPQDINDVTQIVAANLDQAPALRDHLLHVHPDYVEAFDRLLPTARSLKAEESGE
jgi:hypothetical protein